MARHIFGASQSEEASHREHVLGFCWMLTGPSRGGFLAEVVLSMGQGTGELLGYQYNAPSIYRTEF